MRGRFIAIDRENHFLDERSQELLLIARRRRWRVPDRGEIGSEGEEAIAFFLAENARSLLQSTSEFLVRRLQISQALLPLALNPPSRAQSPKQIVVAAMRKLLVICFGVLKTGKPFDPAIAMPA